MIRYPLVILDSGELGELPSGDSLPSTSESTYASQINYLNASSNLQSTNVQAAIDELDSLRIDHHNDLLDIQLAASGVTYGHVTDQTQSIAGRKTFIDLASFDVCASVSKRGIVSNTALPDNTATLFMGTLNVQATLTIPTLSTVRIL